MHSVRRVQRTAEQEAARKRREAIEIESYRRVENRALKLCKDTDAPLADRLAATTKLLDINPEHYTIWNSRRDILHQIGDDKLLEKDLGFVEKLLPRYPKLYWLWDHRRWLLEQLGSQAVWDRELMLVNKLLSMDPRNFHGWQYRRYVVASCEQMTGRSRALEELEFTTSKINANFSNFSAWYNRSQLLAKLPESADLAGELEYARSAIFMDPEDQSAWLYYRWLLTDSKFADEHTEELYNTEERYIAELHAEEPTSVWCTYTLWLICRLAGKERHELLQTLQELDPLRHKRYEHLLQQQQQSKLGARS